MNDYNKRDLIQFVLTDDVKVLKSTAADYQGANGGGTQFFSSEVKSHIEQVKVIQKAP